MRKRNEFSGDLKLVTILAVAIIAITLLTLSHPLIKRRRKALPILGGERNEKGSLRFRKEFLYGTIKELDFDYRTGKLSVEDYQQLRNKYRERALALLQEMEEGGMLGKIEEGLEEEIRARRRPAAEKSGMAEATIIMEGRKAPICFNCGKPCNSGDRFCPYCGRRLQFQG